MPKISVIVPVYKVEQYLHRCVDSILGQSYQDFEVILVDDGSPDNCGAICEEYARKDNRIHVIHQKNGGLSAARNAGMDWVSENSSSQWLTFIDSDDWIHKDYLNAMWNAAKKYDVGLVMCGFVSTDSVPEKEEAAKEASVCMAAERAYVEHYRLCMHAWGKIIHRSLLSQLRFPVGKLHEDAYVTHILTFETKQIAVCDEPLYYYYTNPGSITRVKWTERRLDQIEAHELRLAFLREQGYSMAYDQEVWVYINTIFEQVDQLLDLCLKDKVYTKHLMQMKPKALAALRFGRKNKQYPFERETLRPYFHACILSLFCNKVMWPLFLFLLAGEEAYEKLKRIVKGSAKNADG